MPQINGREPIEIVNVKGPFSFQLNLDTTNWPLYTRQGLVENIKVTKMAKYHTLAQSYLNPVASSAYGMLDTPDLRNWGRSEHLHMALRGIHGFHEKHHRYPEPEGDDAKECVSLANHFNKEAKGKEEHFCEELD